MACAFYGVGFCRKGPACRFRHVRRAPEELPEEVDWDAFQGNLGDATVRPAGAEGEGGEAAAGERRGQNDMFKVAICKHWQKSSEGCPFGDRCHFAHGQHELRARGADEEGAGEGAEGAGGGAAGDGYLVSRCSTSTMPPCYELTTMLRRALTTSRHKGPVGHSLGHQRTSSRCCWRGAADNGWHCCAAPSKVASGLCGCSWRSRIRSYTLYIWLSCGGLKL